ncbi:MAG TPA: UbiA family prenyltransferase [Acidobacteriaceae bacterium]|nr:UbiA family prenyltransferase [Acidobacteriaceae bacterium]
MTEFRVMQPPVAVQVERPLCVDLDGTLVKSDTFVDSLMVLARRQPGAFMRAPFWAMKGKAHVKSQVASLVTLDVVHLPYNRPLLDYLRDEHAAGRKLYLATGADRVLARKVAAHLGIFEEVLASDGAVNLIGRNKLQHLEQRFAADGFDYIGNALPDLPLLQGAQEAMVANPDLRLNLALKSRNVAVSRKFEDRSHLLAALAKALRVHQWAKNLLVFLPLLLAHSFRNATSVLAAVAAFFCFSLTASATYIFNDLLDLESDRVHLHKRKRAFAAGNLSVASGMGIALTLAAVALITAAYLPRKFLVYLLLYFVTTLAYSLSLKKIVLVDVVVLSSLYTIRMLAGSEATHDPVSPWLAAFSIFLFLSLAMVKRFSELQNLHARGATPTSARGYLLSDIEQLRSFGTSSAYASIVIFALYINGRDVVALYHHPTRMWLITPLLILWISRVWLLASRGLLDEDPVVFALKDRMSLLLCLGVAAVAYSAL